MAIVGPTGAGKTTLISLLMCFYDVDQGAVYLDGRSYHYASQLASIRFVGSSSPDTIKENIHYGRPDATDEEVKQAAKEANTHEFIL